MFLPRAARGNRPGSRRAIRQPSRRRIGPRPVPGRRTKTDGGASPRFRLGPAVRFAERLAARHRVGNDPRDPPGGPKSKPFSINRPNVFWVQGDRGREASTKSGVVRLVGNCLTLAPADRPKVLFRHGQGTTFPVSVDAAGPFAVTATWDNSNDPAAGDYDVLFRRNATEEPIVAGRVRISEQTTAYPQEVFNVVNFGDSPTTASTTRTPFSPPSRNSTANNGGTLLFPRAASDDRDDRTAPRSILRGEGANLSQVYWPDTFEPVEASSRAPIRLRSPISSSRAGFTRTVSSATRPFPRNRSTPTKRRTTGRAISPCET